jgi:hypothetical protein
MDFAATNNLMQSFHAIRVGAGTLCFNTETFSAILTF